MPPLQDVVGLLRGLHETDDRLQDKMRDLLQRYFQFLKSTPRTTFKTTRWLRMRLDRDREKRIRRISWTIRLRAQRTVADKPQGLTRRLRGEFTRDWVYTIAKDWSRVEDYEAFNRTLRTLNGLRSEVLLNRMRIRRSFEILWSSRITEADQTPVGRLVSANAPHLKARDIRPLAGVMAYQRALDGTLAELLHVLADWRKAFEGSIMIDFGPAMRPNDDGSLRLYWGFPQRVETREGTRTFTQYIPGRPTDLFMRERRIPASTRKEAGAFMKRILPLERRYRELVGQVGRHRKRVHELLSRVARLDAPAGEGAPRKEAL